MTVSEKHAHTTELPADIQERLARVREVVILLCFMFMARSQAEREALEWEKGVLRREILRKEDDRWTA